MPTDAVSLECHNDGSTFTDYIVTDERIAIDYTYQGVDYHVEAESIDGRTYQGKYGVPHLIKDHPIAEVTFQRFDSSDGSLVLLGDYHIHDTGDEKTWLVRLPAANLRNTPETV